MKVFLTGASSHLAAALLPKLCGVDSVQQVTGVDLRPTPFRHPKFRFMPMDIRDQALSDAIAGHDALIHMAFVVLRGRMDAREMESVNVDGGKSVFQAAAGAGVKRLIHLSSASVYGSGEHLTEASPYRPLPGFLYAHHKAALEQWLDRHHPSAVRLRPHIILGPHAQPLLKRLLRQPFFVALPDPQPLLQCIHEDDVATAILAALDSNAAGPYNLAAPDPYSFKAIIQERAGWSVPVPLAVAKGLLKMIWRLTGAGGEPAWLSGIDKPLTLDCSRAAADLDWLPRFSSRQSIRLTG